MSNPRNVSSKYEQERLRAAEQAQVAYLQGQIDELRRLLKEQSNKYNWAIERIQRIEATALIEGHESQTVDPKVIVIDGVSSQLPDAATRLIDALSTTTGIPQSMLVARGIALLATMHKAEQEGFSLAIIDDEGSVVADITGLSEEGMS